MLFVTSVLLLLPAEDCRSPSGCTRTESLATTVTDLQVTLIGIQDWDQEGNTLCSGKTGRTGIQIDLFRRKCYEINVLHLSILRKALESLTEKAMAPHSSTLPWKIPWMEEPGRLQSMGPLRVGYDWDLTFTFHFHALEKETATHSSVLASRIPGTGEPGGLPSMGSHRVGHDWSDLAAA